MQLDMNLLVALDALLDEGSVGGAAARMHVSSPAMSRTLDRIRHMTGDAILVRNGRAMTPTPYAQAIQADVHDVVLRARTVLARQSRFDIAQVERTFTIQCHDALAAALGPPLLAALRKAAPLAVLRMPAEGAADAQELRQGQVDLQIGAAIPTHADVLHEVLGEDRPMVVMRARHPLAGRKLTLRGYAEADHVTVSRRGRLRDTVDDALATQGMARRVVAAAPTVAAALAWVGAADLLTLVPERISAGAARALKLKVVPVPLRTPALPIVATWHRRHEGDQAHAWLREQVRGLVVKLLAPSDA
ncbi:LysR family transcriptional regulator [Mitsuaria sp. 7]|uniref:LysR family transcriptional regulator n=1 Tax=Mitsuaria sp. 7 TaxID=1658665 RepID=UPI0007DE3332|nr:LysR family transcriptional regulator [Mitsuaria sp. 7]ANH68481.1 LysR family transcriptional regulator [Mitsuaria sp. 7]